MNKKNNYTWKVWLPLILGLIFAALAAVCAMDVAVNQPKVAALREKGLAADSEVTEKFEKTTERTDRKGRRKTSTSHYFTLRYDVNAKTSFAEAASTGKLQTNPYPAVTTADKSVSKADYENTAIGAKMQVIYLPETAREPEFLEFVKSYSPLKAGLGGAALLAAALACSWVCWKVWRKEKAAAAALSGPARL